MPDQRAHRKPKKQSIGPHAYPMGLSRSRTVTRPHYQIFIIRNTESRYSCKRIFNRPVVRQAYRATRPYDIEIVQYRYMRNYDWRRAEYDTRQDRRASVLPKGDVSDSEGSES